MIDICFNYSFYHTLFEISDLIQSDGVFHLGLRLNYGQLDGNLFEKQARTGADTCKYIYKPFTEEELQDEYTELLTDLLNDTTAVKELLADGHAVRLWLSNNAGDRCGLYWFCDFAKHYTNKISVVMCPPYEYIPYLNTASILHTWSLCDEYSVPRIAPAPRVLNEHERTAYVKEWARLVKENASFRILIDDTVASVDESIFDNFIFGFATPNPQSERTIMGKVLGKLQGGCTCAFISMRIEHFIAAGKIKVCEEKVDEDHCYWDRTIALT